MRAERIELREIQLPLVHFFETSFHRVYHRRILLTSVFADGLVGVGECTAPEDPYYNYETIETAWHVMKDYVVPLLLNRELGSAAEVIGWLTRIRGHNMAKAGIEVAFWDLEAKIKNTPLYKLIGGTRTEIACGVSIGIQDDVPELIKKIQTELQTGYQRIKIKIKPGWDYEVVAEVRKNFPTIALMVDANSAYSLADIDLFRKLDDFNLMMIEQPLAYDDIFDHAKLQKEIRTPVCLDESIVNLSAAQKAVDLASCKIINIKLGRVGGFTAAKTIHDFCRRRGVPVWCGGMLESGIGRAHNIALSTLEGFTLPGDVSASQRYYERDVIRPPVEVNQQGLIKVPHTPGIGYAPDLEWIDAVTVRKEVFS